MLEQPPRRGTQHNRQHAKRNIRAVDHLRKGDLRHPWEFLAAVFEREIESGPTICNLLRQGFADFFRQVHAAIDEASTLCVADRVSGSESVGCEARPRGEYAARRRDIRVSIGREELFPSRDLVEYEQSFRQRRYVRHVGNYRPARRAAVARSSMAPRRGSITTPY